MQAISWLAKLNAVVNICIVAALGVFVWPLVSARVGRARPPPTAESSPPPVAAMVLSPAPPSSAPPPPVEYVEHPAPVTPMVRPAVDPAPPHRGPGYADRTLWAPGMCFPIESPAYAASAIRLSGGPRTSRSGPETCSAGTALAPMQDTFCASRSVTNVFCKGGLGRQGIDLRTNTCANGALWAVAADGGLISNVSRVAVTLTSDKPPYRQYRYLRLDMSQLSALEGDRVLPGDHIGKIRPSPAGMGFEIRVPINSVNANGKPVSVLTVVPPYSSLVAANRRRLKGDDCR